jgi:hypothetical protein
MFSPITLDWKGQPVTIPADALLGAIATVEKVVTFNEMLEFDRRQAYPGALMARAYGALLRYAGVKVTDEEVYAGLFGDAELASNVTGSMQILMVMMVPPHLRRGEIEPPVTKVGEAEPPKSKPARHSGSSSTISRSSSRTSGARRSNSGSSRRGKSTG